MVYINLVYQSGNVGDTLTTHNEYLKFRTWQKFGAYIDELHTLYDVVVILLISEICKNYYDKRTKKY